jgi:hypothetical protein
MPQQGARHPEGNTIRQRIHAGQDANAQRVLASASGKVTPESAGSRIDVQHPDFTKALRVSSTTNRWKTQATGATNAEGRFAVRGFLGDYELTVAKAGRVARRTFQLSKAGCSLRLVLPSRPTAAAAR